ncbi:helix-turn-helix domain-containing protein [Nocardia thailandica]|uniref:helix-turn-helix domain-containing protein n=1 Tax=Nocardia thailandica TaxID=257275 RepID=UPI00031286E0|nr:helix-turn-helix domain-containing protein [Nocardia thailandica]
MTPTSRHITTWTGREVRALRRAALRLTQREFAELLGFSVAAVSKWERRGATITLTARHAEAMDTVLSRLSPADRARLDAALADHPGTAPAEAAAIAARLRALSALSTDDALADTYTLTLHAVLDDHATAPRRVLAHHLHHTHLALSDLLTHGRHPRHAARFFHLAAHTASLLAFLHTDLGDHGAAQLYCREARTLARLVADRDLETWVWAIESRCALHRGDHHAAGDLAEQGLSLATTAMRALHAA